jgi:hypothetical protein
VDFNAIDGTRADGGQQRGDAAARPLVDSVLKSGATTFRTGVRTWVGRGLEGNNIDDELAAAGIRLPRASLGEGPRAGNVGGRNPAEQALVFGGGRYEKVVRDILDAFDPDGTPIANVKKGTYHLEKLSCR